MYFCSTLTYAIENLEQVFNMDKKQIALKLSKSKSADSSQPWHELCFICQKLFDKNPNCRPSCQDMLTQLLKIRLDIKSGIERPWCSCLANRDAEIDYETWFRAAAEDDVTSVIAFLSLGNLDVNARDDEQQKTALMFAAEGNAVSVVKELLKREELDINLQNDAGSTAFSLATQKENSSVMAELLKTGSVFNSIVQIANLHDADGGVGQLNRRKSVVQLSQLNGVKGTVVEQLSELDALEFGNRVSQHGGKTKQLFKFTPKSMNIFLY